MSFIRLYYMQHNCENAIFGGAVTFAFCALKSWMDERYQFMATKASKLHYTSQLGSYLSLSVSTVMVRERSE